MPALVLSRNDIFPIDRMPETGIGVITVHSMRGTVVLHHAIDVRDSSTFMFTENEVARIITGLLTEHSYDLVQRYTITEDSELHGTYTMVFPDHEDVVGDVTALVRQRGVMFAPRGCGCSSVCSCRATHTTQVDVILSDPRTDPVEVFTNFDEALDHALPSYMYDED